MRNNLKQIGLGLHAHHAARKYFPVSYSQWAYEPNMGPGLLNDLFPTFGWHVYLLPYIEETEIYQSLNLNASSRVPPNSNFDGKAIPTYLCPSDSRSQFVITDPASGAKYGSIYMDPCPAAAAHSYMESGWVFDCQTDGPLYSGSCINSGGRGFAADEDHNTHGDAWSSATLGLRRRISEITDGTSKTLAVSENLPDCYLWSNWMYGDTYNFSSSIGINTFMSGCCRWLGGNWANYLPCRGFKSMHPGGVNGCMADGSVQFIAEEIDITLFQQLSTIAGGDVASLPHDL